MSHLTTVPRSIEKDTLPRQLNAEPQEFDQIERYGVVAQLLERMFADISAPVRVLEVGCNVLHLLPRFLDSRRYQVMRCDILPFASDEDFLCIDEKQPLPFADETFDAVVALEVLEHLPAERRREFLSDCLRVARHGAVFTCPNGVPEVIEAERLASAVYQQANGTPHPFLQEHQHFGIPTEQEITSLLGELEYPFAVFDNARLDIWLTMMLAENVRSHQALSELQKRLNQPVARLLQAEGIPYRKVYVCCKTFEASAALEPTGRKSWLAGAGQGQADPVTAQHYMIQMLCQALAGSQAEAGGRQMQLLAQQAELDGLKQQYLIHYNLLQGVTHSWSWNLMTPLRYLKRLLRPSGFDARSLMPWNQLEAIPERGSGHWRSLGPDPHFFVPCMLTKGWVRLRLKLNSSVQARFEVYIDPEKGTHQPECIGRTDIRSTVEGDFYLYVPREVTAMRFDPIDVAGEFHLETFEVKPVAGPVALLRAVGGKLRQLRAHARPSRALRRAARLLLHGDMKEFGHRLFHGLRRPTFTGPGQYDEQAEYEAWRRRRLLTDAHRERINRQIGEMTEPPLISILMPVYNINEHYLRQAIESVRRQIYPHWQLCITDDASPSPHVARVLAEYTALDPRIQVVRHAENRGIAAASNSALALAKGDYVALLDHDDELAELALFRMAAKIIADRRLDMIYSDEDKIDVDGRHVEPFFKPEWSPEYFLSCMYTCHLGVYRASLVREVGGFRSEFDSAQDYDLVLRIIARTDRIGHVPEILYHWRKLPTSTASGSQAKPQACVVARRAIQDYLDATDQPGTVEPGPGPGLHHVRYALARHPRVSIIIPSACRPVLIRGEPTYHILNIVQCIRNKSTYDNYEILLLHPGELSAELRRRLEPFDVLPATYPEPFNWSATMNLGAARATGEQLLFLNDDMEVITSDWLESMLEFAQHPDIGAVGARLLFPDGRVQHVGVTMLGCHPGHPFYLAERDHLGYYNSSMVHRNCVAVTGACLMTRAEVFRALGGFDMDFPLNYNDIDYCLRVLGTGRRIVYTPFAELYHFESATKTGTYPHELEAFKKRWQPHWPRDPYVSPNLASQPDFRIDANWPPVDG